MPPQTPSQQMPNNIWRIGFFVLLGIVIVVAGAVSWRTIEQQKGGAQVPSPASTTNQSAGTVFTDQKRIAAWDALDFVPAGAADQDPTLRGYHPLQIIGRGLVLARTDPQLPARIQELKNDSFIDVFKMSEIEKDFLIKALKTGNSIKAQDNKTTTPSEPLTMDDLQGAQIYLACGLDLKSVDKLIGQEVEVPGERCTSAFDVEAVLPSGEAVYVGSGFYD
jgi:hypothetical protein